MVMMALSAGLDGMVLAGWMVKRTSIVQNFKFVVERLKYFAGEQAQVMSSDRGLTGRTIQLQLSLHQDKARRPYQPAPGQGGRESDEAPVGATNREMRRPSLGTLEGFFYV
jgi:hypothetical protein